LCKQGQCLLDKLIAISLSLHTQHQNPFSQKFARGSDVRFVGKAAIRHLERLPRRFEGRAEDINDLGVKALAY